MRLIDADRLKVNMPQRMIRVLGEEYEDTKYKYETIKAINSEPTVEAIPMKWLVEYIWGADTHEEKRALRKMCIQWEKENDKI